MRKLPRGRHESRWTRAILLGVAALVVAAPGCARRSQQQPSSPVATTTPEPGGQAPAPDRAGSGTETRSPAESEFPPVFFGFDSFSLSEEARAVLDRTATGLRRSAERTVVVEGHCDERGTTEYNLALGERRAATVREYLVASGVAPERIRIISYGKERPFDPGRSEDAWSRNRRAHFALP